MRDALLARQSDVVRADAVVVERQRVEQEATAFALAQSKRQLREQRLRRRTQLAAEHQDAIALRLCDQLAHVSQHARFDAEPSRRRFVVLCARERENDRVLRAGVDVYELRRLLLQTDGDAVEDDEPRTIVPDCLPDLLARLTVEGALG